jgi:hypothetical protein
MLEKLKTDFYAMLVKLGLNVSDNRSFEEGESPWMMLRTNGYQRVQSFGLSASKITLVLDIFSQYNGEREIIKVIDKVASNLEPFILQHPEVLYCFQKTVKILDDKTTGPVRKHGVVSYEFLMGINTPEEEETEPNE